ncbi:hypothetical protein [Pseudomonas aeruginosa]|uniref:hypothetical protein n=1 Tax=Pseudomonas aeruginosa TaxID=287 RepID=UPI00298FA801|nr:hypothetical protein [Pseudomonas aeruginosa]MDW8831474.1 hypothetical protein [Pseudomonas aeruginosa]
MSKELNKAPVEQAGGDELEKFLAWANNEYEVEEGYELNESNTSVRENKKGWMARAALAQPSPVSEVLIYACKNLAQITSSDGSGHADIAMAVLRMAGVGDDERERLVNEWKAARAWKPSPAQAEAEAERPEVAEVAFVLRNIGAMDAEDIDGDNVDLRFEDAEGRDTGCDVSIVEYAEKAADLFEQHERIVGALRAEITQLRQHKNDYMDAGQETYRALQNEIREREAEIARLDGLVSSRTTERDAALAEVERLRESKGDPSGSFDRCMKMMYERDENAKRLDAALARVAELEKGTVYVEARQCDECQHVGINDSADGLAACHDCDWTGPEPDEDKCPDCQRENCMAAACPQCGARYVLVASEEIAAPVAQAQHSVPEGWRIERSAERIVVMNMKNGAGYAAARDGESGIAESVLYLLAADLLAAAPGKEVPQAWLDVQAERRRQITAEGWTPEHDDAHSHGQMARAAACYALAGSSAQNDGTAALLVSLAWPWDQQWWKPTTARRDLVKSCALALAEIERLDRAAERGKEVGHE